jgi:hypothetical protein
VEISLRSYPPALVEDLAHPLVRKLRVLGEPVGRNAHGNKKFLPEELAGMHVDVALHRIKGNR